MNVFQKSELMRKKFGEDPEHRCRDCNHRVVYCGNRKYPKCEVFGVNNSENTDWGSWVMACGMFNKDTEERNVFLDENKRIVTSIRRKEKPVEQKETLF